MPAGATGSADNYRSSVWIGLDGQRLYLNSSLPQIGTVQYIDGSSGRNIPKAGAWFQWWEREPASRRPFLWILTVEPGDMIACALILVDDENVQFIIKNQTTGVLVLPFIIRRRRLICITRQPSSSYGSQARPQNGFWNDRAKSYFISSVMAFVQQRGLCSRLPDYGTEVLDNCLAVSAPKPGAPGRTHALHGARLIDMFRVEKNPNRTTYISEAKSEGDQTITTFFM